ISLSTAASRICGNVQCGQANVEKHNFIRASMCQAQKIHHLWPRTQVRGQDHALACVATTESDHPRVPLPILQNHRAVSREDLLRYYHRTELHWSRHLGEETTLDVGTAITNPELPSEANMMLDISLAAEMSADEAMRQIDEHFASCGTRC